MVCDEAHKLAATFFGGEVKYTKRYQLSQLLSGLTCHFLLMTATPHSGKEEDFQPFLALLDGDRFAGCFRDGVHQVGVSDLMRRMVKENLLKFDGRPLFPERIASSVPYKLSDAEARLYQEVLACLLVCVGVCGVGVWVVGCGVGPRPGAWAFWGVERIWRSVWPVVGACR